MADQSPLFLNAIDDWIADRPIDRKLVTSLEYQSQLALELEDVKLAEAAVLEANARLIISERWKTTHICTAFEGIQRHLGWNESSHRWLALLWNQAFLSQKREEGILMLLKIADGTLHTSSLLPAAEILLPTLPLGATEALQVFGAILERFSNEFKVYKIWSALDQFGNANRSVAIEIIDLWNAGAPPIHGSIAAYLLGCLRGSNLTSTQIDNFEHIDNRWESHKEPEAEELYFRSWIQTSRKGNMSTRTYTSLLARIDSMETFRKFAFSWHVIRWIQNAPLDSEQFGLGWTWLLNLASPTLPADCKTNLADAAADLVIRREFDALELVIRASPFEAENDQAWGCIQFILHHVLDKTPDNFHDVLLGVIDKNAEALEKRLGDYHHLQDFAADLISTDPQKLVPALLGSDRTAIRRIGFKIYDVIGTAPLISEEFQQLPDQVLLRALYEARRIAVHGNAMGYFLVSLALVADRFDGEFRSELAQSIILHAKDTHECREQFKQHGIHLSLIANALDAADKYFDRLDLVRSSSVARMAVKGSKAASRAYNKRFSKLMGESAEANSLLGMFPKLRVCYGRKVRIFSNGKFDRTTELNEISTSTEMPRLFAIDPEGLALERIDASGWIMESKQRMSAPQEDIQNGE